MSGVATLPPRDRLRAIDPARAWLATAAIAALRLTPAGALAVVADAVDAARDGTAWILFDTHHGRFGLAPLLVDGAQPAMTVAPGQPDAVVAMATLGRLEPLVAAIETALASELHPADLGLAPPPGALLFDLACTASDDVRHRALLAVPADMPPPARPAGLAPRLPDAMRLPCTASVGGPLVREEALGRLRPGAMLLLGLGPLAARVTVAGRPIDRRATIDLATRGLRIGAEHQGADVDDLTQEPTGTAGPDEGARAPAGLMLRTSVVIAGGEIAAGTLATLGAGAVLPLPGSGASLPVRVLAGGTPVAEGELVAVGDGFGVLIGRTLVGVGD